MNIKYDKSNCFYLYKYLNTFVGNIKLMNNFEI